MRPSACEHCAIDFDTPYYERTSYTRVAIPAVLFLVSLVLNSLAVSIVHDFARDQPPLSDIYLLVGEQRWVEPYVNAGVGTCIGCAFALVALHKYRVLILSRLLLITGTMFMLRVMSVSVTHLPPATTWNTTNALCDKAEPLTIEILWSRFAAVLFTFGATERVCGGLLFSGHTMTAVLSTLIVRHYSPLRLRLFAYVHTALVTICIVFIVLSRMHYTVDCFIAWWLSYGVFVLYHCVYEHRRKRPPVPPEMRSLLRPHDESTVAAEMKRCALASTALERYALAPLAAYLERHMPVGKMPNTLNWPLGRPAVLVGALKWASAAELCDGHGCGDGGSTEQSDAGEPSASVTVANEAQRYDAGEGDSARGHSRTRSVH